MNPDAVAVFLASLLLLGAMRKRMSNRPNYKSRSKIDRTPATAGAASKESAK